MKKNLAIYLAGSIKKEHETPETYWTDDDMATIRQCLPEFEVAFLNPAFRTDNLSDQRSVFGRDMLQVFCSDFVFVDARDRRGLGVGSEMMWAKINQIPVLTWAPKDSHYHKSQTTILGIPVSNFIHPFVEALSDKIVETLQEGAQWMQTEISNIKGIDSIHSAMQYYKENQFANDAPMKKLAELNDNLSRRIKWKPSNGPTLKK